MSASFEYAKNSNLAATDPIIFTCIHIKKHFVCLQSYFECVKMSKLRGGPTILHNSNKKRQKDEDKKESGT
jgi:hypothetical protein